MIQIKINVTDTASDLLKSVVSSLSQKQMVETNEIAGRAAVNAAIKYHREFDRAKGWRGKRYLGAGRADGSSFGAGVARGWHFIDSTKNGATITNNADHYAFKVRGGTITPKRGNWLTIPLIREAQGFYVSVYQQNTGRKLFRPKGKNVLMESLTTGEVRSVYALVKKVTQRPWPGALPPSDVLTSAFVKRWRKSIAEIIEKS
jgi:hypothetical protein